jgi:hypothetical protein
MLQPNALTLPTVFGVDTSGSSELQNTDASS